MLCIFNLVFLFQHRCVSIFNDKKTNAPTGFALGSIEGRVAIQYVNPTNPKDNFTFKCHRSNVPPNGGIQDIYAVSVVYVYIFVFVVHNNIINSLFNSSYFSFF